MAYLQRIDDNWGIRRFRLRRLCGFQTDSAAVGFVGIRYSPSDHDGWLVAWYDAEVQRLRNDEFCIPLDVVLDGGSERWRDEHVVPQIRKVYGNCFVSAPEEANETELLCPMCRTQNLVQVPII